MNNIRNEYIRISKISPIWLFIIILQAGLLQADTSISAAMEVLGRVLPERADEFRFINIDKDNGKDVFEIKSENNLIVISGSSPASSASTVTMDL